MEFLKQNEIPFIHYLYEHIAKEERKNYKKKIPCQYYIFNLIDYESTFEHTFLYQLCCDKKWICKTSLDYEQLLLLFFLFFLKENVEAHFIPYFSESYIIYKKETNDTIQIPNIKEYETKELEKDIKKLHENDFETWTKAIQYVLFYEQLYSQKYPPFSFCSYDDITMLPDTTNEFTSPCEKRQIIDFFILSEKNKMTYLKYMIQKEEKSGFNTSNSFEKLTQIIWILSQNIVEYL